MSIGKLSWIFSYIHGNKIYLQIKFAVCGNLTNMNDSNKSKGSAQAKKFGQYNSFLEDEGSAQDKQFTIQHFFR